MELTHWDDPAYNSAVYNLRVYELSLGDVRPYVIDDEIYYKLEDLQKATRITSGRRSVGYEMLDQLKEGFTPDDLVREVLFQLAGEVGRKMLEDLLENPLEFGQKNAMKIARNIAGKTPEEMPS